MKAILITGAYGGMGKATTEFLAKNGYTVFALDKIVGDRKENIIPIQADITDEESIKNAFNEVKTQCDSLHCIIHFAGIYMLDSLVEIENESFKRIFDINVTGAFLINKTFLPLVEKGGRIVITTSELAPLDPLPFTGIYAIAEGSRTRNGLKCHFCPSLRYLHREIRPVCPCASALI